MLGNYTRRSFLSTAAVTAGLVGLAGCNAAPADGGTSASSSAKGSGYTETATDFGYTIVDNGDGKRLSYSPESGLKLIEQDGYAFKDFEGTGELVPYEDWRLSAEERAEDLSQRISIEQITGLMCFSGHQRTVEDDCSLTEEQTTFLDGHVRAVLNAANGYAAFKQAKWANNMQAYVEGSGNKIPINFSSDPRNGKNATNWPGNLALAASFDPEVARQSGAGMGADLRHMGIATFLGPQTDVATDPRWARFDGTFGEDPALSRDMCRALIDGLQSTVDENGNDLGWGKDSVVSMVKHWPAEGAGEGGREGHTDGGKFAVYPNDNFDALMIPFVDGAFKLNGKTACAAAIMTSYTIAYDEDKKYGELVGSGFSEYKITDLLRGQFKFQGPACTDWMVIEDPGNASGGGGSSNVGRFTCWGLEDTNEWNPAKRASKCVEVGVDQIGGCNDPTILMAAYDTMKEQLGEETADKNFRTVGKRLLLGYFNTGLFEDPYVDPDETKKAIDAEPEDVVKAALDAQAKCIVMLKNKGGVIKKAEGDAKPKVYVPMRFTEAAKTVSGMGDPVWSETPATCDLPLVKGTLDKYFDVVTDTLADTLTGPTDEKTGVTAPTWDDLTRATADDLAGIDYVLVCAAGPVNASSRRGQDENGDFIPLSVQYRPYTADGPNVRKTSIAGDILPDGTQENRSYFGKSSMVTNEKQLDQILEAADMAKTLGVPCIVILDIKQPMCVYEFEDKVDAIVVSMSGCTEAACQIVSGAVEPSGLMPMQMPKDMDDVEKQQEDLSREMDCYTDSEGNKYDFGFGLSWSGPISDKRTEEYCVAPLTKYEG